MASGTRQGRLGNRPTLKPLAAALVAACASAPAAALDYTWLGGNGDYESPANWSFLGVPGAGDSATINSGIATLSNNRPIDAFTIAGGQLRGAGNLTASGLVRMLGGQIGGDGGQAIANGGLLIGGNAVKSLGAGNGAISSGIVNNGAGTWSGTGNIDNWSSGRFTNGAGGSLDIQTDADFLNGTFINQGSVVKSVGAGGTAKTIVSALFSNSGSVVAEQGILALTGGGTHNGSFGTSASGWIEFAGSGTNRRHELLAGSSVTGNVRHISSFGPTVVNLGASYGTTRTEIVAEGIFEVAAGASASTVTLGVLGGSFRGGGDFTASGLTTFTGGQIGGSGGQVVANGGLVISGNAVKTLGIGNGTSSSGVVNNGAGTWSGTGNIDNWSSGRFTNGAGGSLDIQTDADFLNGTFINQGSVVKSVGAGGTAKTIVSALFNNSGSVVAEQGILALTGGGTHNGSFGTSASGWIEFAGSGTNRRHELLAGSSVTGNVRHISSFGPTVVNLGASYGTTRTEIVAEGIFEVAAGASASTVTLGVLGGSFRGGGDFTASGLTTFTGGQIGGSGGQVVANGGLVISGNAVKTLGIGNGTSSSGVVNNGAGTWSGTGNIDNWSSGRFTNGAGGSLDIQTDADFLNGTFINQGSVVKSVGAGGSARTLISAAFANTGSVDVQQGVLEVSTAFANAGTVRVNSGAIFHGSSTDFSNAATGLMTGRGTVRTAVGDELVNHGRIGPGDSTGTLTIDGDLRFGASGSAEFELTSLADFDRLVISDDATFLGTLMVLNLGYTPVLGDSFRVIVFDQRLSSSTFANLAWSGFAPEVVFTATYNLHDVTLTVTAVPVPVPEPGTWALLLAGAATLGSLVRRRSGWAQDSSVASFTARS